ncbi:MAG: cytochrome c oxidase assembly protein [Candidatus Binataceae bacterium]
MNISKSKLAVGLFIFSEVQFFGVLIVAYIYYHLQPAAGPSAANSLDPWRVGAFSAALFLSSATMAMADRSVRRNWRNGALFWLALTVILGIVFLGGQLQEYAGLISHGVTVSRDLFGSTFFTLTGFHFLHVFAGVCAMTIMFAVIGSGHFREQQHEAFAAIGLYWHFVDAVWIVIFSIICLWAFLLAGMERILTTWDIDPSIPIGCAILLAAYFIVNRRDRSRSAFFIAGVVILFIALTSPIDTLADTYLFSAHMVQHMILELIVPPLMLLGLTKNFAAKITAVPGLGAIERVLRRPAPAWILGMGTLWIWHAPLLYNLTLQNEDIHIVEHLLFLITATIFWWPILSPLAESRMNDLFAVLYLIAAMLATSLLGIVLTFAHPGLYPAYLHPHDWLGILPLLRQQWGLTPEVDQQLGGLVMWVPGGLFFLGAVFLVMVRWYQAPEVDIAPISAGERV